MIFTEHKDFDEIYKSVKHLSLLSRDRLNALHNAGLYCSTIDGDFVELGCHCGGTSLMLSKLLHNGSKLHSFDSFRGFHNLTDKDGNFPFTHGEYWCHADYVKKLLRSDNIIVYDGWIEDTLKEVNGITFSLIHFDLDTYSSTKFALQELWRRVTKGGCVVFDNYLHWEGEKKAVDEFLVDISRYNHWLLSPQLGVIKT